LHDFSAVNCRLHFDPIDALDSWQLKEFDGGKCVNPLKKAGILFFCPLDELQAVHIAVSASMTMNPPSRNAMRKDPMQ